MGKGVAVRMAVVVVLAFAGAMPVVAQASVVSADSLLATKAETVEWLKASGAALMHSHASTTSRAGLTIRSGAVRDLDVKDCRVSWVSADSLIDPAAGVRHGSDSYHEVPMSDVDLAGLRSSDQDGYLMVRIPLRASVAPTIVSRGIQSNRVFPLATFATVPVASLHDAIRVIKAIDRLASLCGAKREPY